MKTFVSTSSTQDDVKLVEKYIRRYGSDFHQHLNISMRDAKAMLKYLDEQYHSHNKSVVVDETYDILSDWYTEKSKAKVKTVGAKVKGKRSVKVRLEVPMASQDKLKPGSDLSKFLKASMYVIGDKLDGISLEIAYDGGVPVQACTRGNGLIGQDVSDVIPALNIPQQIPMTSRFLVRCEFVMKKRTFDSGFSKHAGTGEFATARNLGGGLLTRNVPSDQVRAFDVVAYEIVKGKGAGQRLSLQLTVLKRYGFNVVRHRLVSKLDEAKLIELHNNFKKRSKYEIDGIIVTQDVSYRVTKENPKHSKAFKINSLDNSRVVKIVEIEWNKSRHSKSIPRIKIDPIILGGVEVTWLTGHSYYYIQNGYTSSDYKKAQKAGKTLPVRPLNVGAEIRVIRSGDVIPYIMEVVKPARRAAQPPGKFQLDEEGVHAVYGGAASADIKKKRIAHFFKALDVEGLKSGIIDRLYENGYNTIRKVLRVTVDDLLQLEGFQERSATKLVNAIAAGVKKNATFPNLAYGSHLFGSKIGTSKLQEVLDAIPNIMELANEEPEVLEARIRKVKGIANTATDIAKGLPKFAEFVAKTRIKIIRAAAVQTVSTKLSGVKILLTGVRDADLVAAVKAHGGAEASTVKSATYVITKPGTSNKKTVAAEELNIPIMSVEEFRKRFKL